MKEQILELKKEVCELYIKLIKFNNSNGQSQYYCGDDKYIWVTENVLVNFIRNNKFDDISFFEFVEIEFYIFGHKYSLYSEESINEHVIEVVDREIINIKKYLRNL